MFICKVKQKCVESNKDFVILYPREYHSLVSLLNVEQEVFKTQLSNKTSALQSAIVEIVRHSFNSRPIQTVCILTHFPDWADKFI